MLKRDRDDLVKRWREQPAAGAHALRIERDALVLNPRMALFGDTTAHDVVASEGLTEVARLASEHYDSLPARSVYEVRRAFRSLEERPHAQGNPVAQCPLDHDRNPRRGEHDAAGTRRRAQLVGLDRWRIGYRTRLATTPARAPDLSGN